MGLHSSFVAQLTFAQGLIIGQASILVLFFFVFRYLFLTQDPLNQPTAYRPRPAHKAQSTKDNRQHPASKFESTEWLNAILLHVINVYRSKLREGSSGPQSEDIMRERVQEFVNSIRPKEILSPVVIHAIDLGASAPQLSNAQSKSLPDKDSVGFDLSYTDTVSVSLSTAYLFNYPALAFAQLPVSLTISLSLFACSVVISPPLLSSPAPAITLSIKPDFTLQLETSSLLGSRAKLADVPKLHELITQQIRRQLVQRGSIKIPLPGLASVIEVEREIRREMAPSSLTP